MIDYDKIVVDEQFNRYTKLIENAGYDGHDVVISRHNNIYTVNRNNGVIVAKATWTTYSSVVIRLSNADVCYFDLMSRQHIAEPVLDERYLTHRLIDGIIVADIETYRG